jgi:hypothetical protein
MQWFIGSEVSILERTGLLAILHTFFIPQLNLPILCHEMIILFPNWISMLYLEFRYENMMYVSMDAWFSMELIRTIKIVYVLCYYHNTRYKLCTRDSCKYTSLNLTIKFFSCCLTKLFINSLKFI